MFIKSKDNLQSETNTDHDRKSYLDQCASQLTSAVRWLQAQIIDSLWIIQICNLVQFATNSAWQSLKQQKVTDFFKTWILEINLK